MGLAVLHVGVLDDHRHVEYHRVRPFVWYFSWSSLCCGSMVRDFRECIWTGGIGPVDGDLDVIPKHCQKTRTDEPIHHAHLQPLRSIRLLTDAERGPRRR